MRLLDQQTDHRCRGQRRDRGDGGVVPRDGERLGVLAGVERTRIAKPLPVTADRLRKISRRRAQRVARAQAPVVAARRLTDAVEVLPSESECAVTAGSGRRPHGTLPREVSIVRE